MGASEIAKGALAVAAVGVVGIVGVRLWQSSRLAVETGRAIQGIRESGAEGGPGAVQTFIESLRAQGAYAGGAPGAAAAIVSNQGAGEQGNRILLAARDALRAAHSPAQLGRNLSVVRPRDTSSNWRMAEGCWLPSEGEAAGWRTDPIEQVRGLDLGYALTYLADVYPPPEGNGRIVCYPREHGHINVTVVEGRSDDRHTVKLATQRGIAASADYQVMLTSTIQVGRVAIFKLSEHRFLTPEECEGLIFAADTMFSRRNVNRGNIVLTDWKWYRALPSSYLRSMCTALDRAVKFQPFQPARLVSKRT